MIEQQLQEAITSKNFDAAQGITKQFGEQVRNDLRRAANQRERQQIFDRAFSVLTENLYLARVVRAHLSTELQNNTGSFLYQNSRAEQHRWRIDA